MTQWTDIARARALVGAFGGRLRFGLASAGRELKDGGYARIGGTMGDPAEVDGQWQIMNAAALRFPALRGGAEQQVDEVLIFDGADQLLTRSAIEPVPVIPRLQIVFEPGDISAALLEG